MITLHSPSHDVLYLTKAQHDANVNVVYPKGTVIWLKDTLYYKLADGVRTLGQLKYLISVPIYDTTRFSSPFLLNNRPYVSGSSLVRDFSFSLNRSSAAYSSNTYMSSLLFVPHRILCDGIGFQTSTINGATPVNFKMALYSYNMNTDTATKIISDVVYTIAASEGVGHKIATIPATVLDTGFYLFVSINDVNSPNIWFNTVPLYMTWNFGATFGAVFRFSQSGTYANPLPSTVQFNNAQVGGGQTAVLLRYTDNF